MLVGSTGACLGSPYVSPLSELESMLISSTRSSLAYFLLFLPLLSRICNILQRRPNSSLQQLWRAESVKNSFLNDQNLNRVNSHLETLLTFSFCNIYEKKTESKTTFMKFHTAMVKQSHGSGTSTIFVIVDEFNKENPSAAFEVLEIWQKTLIPFLRKMHSIHHVSTTHKVAFMPVVHRKLIPYLFLCFLHWDNNTPVDKQKLTDQNFNIIF